MKYSKPRDREPCTLDLPIDPKLGLIVSMCVFTAVVLPLCAKACADKGMRRQGHADNMTLLFLLFWKWVVPRIILTAACRFAGAQESEEDAKIAHKLQHPAAIEGTKGRKRISGGKRK